VILESHDQLIHININVNINIKCIKVLIDIDIDIDIDVIKYCKIIKKLYLYNTLCLIILY
jgi:hypothetical protein